MGKTWIVVADKARARIFEASEQGGKPEELRDIQHPQSRFPTRELKTDKQGRSFDSFGPGRHAMSENVSPKQHEAERFCREVAEALEHARNEHRFDRLVIVAAPAFLGELRGELSDPTARLVEREIDKNLADMKADEIMEHLPEDVLE